MKYVRTHETRDKFLADKDSTSRGFRLAPTLYKYSDDTEDEDNRDHIYLELDDPRKHEGSTYMEIALNSDVEFSFYIGNKFAYKRVSKLRSPFRMMNYIRRDSSELRRSVLSLR